MAIIKDIEVRIKSTASGGYLEEYDNSKKGSQNNGLQCERFIEAETNAEFSINIILKPGFTYSGSDEILAQLKIDDGAIVSHERCFRRALEDRNRKDNIVHPWETCDAELRDGYVRFGFTFGSISIDEDLEVNSNTVKEQSNALGVILVKVYRTDLMQVTTSVERTREDTVGERLEWGSTDLVKKACVSHTMKYAVSNTPTLSALTLFSGGRASQMTAAGMLRPPTHLYKSLSENTGEMAEFTFRYRFRMSLQVLGCIDSFSASEPAKDPTSDT